MAGMLALHPVEPRRDQGLQSFAPAAVAGMRPDCQRAGLVHDGDRVLDRQTLPDYECASRGSEILRERLPKILIKAARDQRTSDVRPPNRAAVGLQTNCFTRG